MTKQQPTDKNGFAKLKTKKRTRFSVIDAFNERVAIKNAHPEHPTLTAFALSILFPKDKSKKGRG